MLNKITAVSPASNTVAKTNFSQKKIDATNPVNFKGSYNYSAPKIAGAYRGYNNINLASSVSFTGLSVVFEDLSKAMVTCQDIEHGKEGESVGAGTNISKLLEKYQDELLNVNDAAKSDVVIFEEKDDKNDVVKITDARSQIKKGEDNALTFEMVVREPRAPKEMSKRTDCPQQTIKFKLEPKSIKKNSRNGDYIAGTKEDAYVLNTKGKLMGVIQDHDNVILTNAGKIKSKKGPVLELEARQYIQTGLSEESKKQAESSLATIKNYNEPAFIKIGSILNSMLASNKTIYENKFKPIDPALTVAPVVREREGGSVGGGTELVIGMEQGRFVPEIIDSIKTFEEKINSGEIVLDKFEPKGDAQSVQISMLAGGYGSRAEYANASSEKIMHGKQNGSDMTKGCFRTATGLTPMETTFISLHKAGLLDCSKGNFGIGKNIKFYLNDSGKNTGNGGFTRDMYDSMEREGRKSLMIFPNDAMSRIPNAISKMTEIMNSGNAAMVMVAKEVDKEDARGKLGIMKINDNQEIAAFAEKPKTFGEGYVDNNGKCFANTFQFAVSKEAFEALSIVEPYLPPISLGKESRDWSKVLTPVLMAITQNDDPVKMQAQIKDAMSNVKEFKKGLNEMPLDALAKAKRVLGNQKIYAVKTAEPWADCGTLNALYHTTMQIATNEFPLEDFERKHVLDSINPQTGLVASSPEQKAEIENKYDIEGEIMVVPKAKRVPPSIIKQYKDSITKYTDKN